MSWVKLSVFNNFNKTYDTEIINLDNIVSIKPKGERGDARIVIAAISNTSTKDGKTYHNLTELRISDESAVNLETFLELKDPIADLTQGRGGAPQKSHAPWG